MGAVPEPLARVISELSRLPGIGEKTALRLALHLLRGERSQADALARALSALRDEIHFCSVCCALTANDPCDLCSDGERPDDLVCVVESSSDLLALERSATFRGRYHVLHGVLSPLDGIGPEDLRIAELLERLRAGGVAEVILATNPTSEGQATSLYLADLIKPMGIRVTRIAHGLPMGGEVEYADAATLGFAVNGRSEL